MPDFDGPLSCSVDGSSADNYCNLDAVTAGCLVLMGDHFRAVTVTERPELPGNERVGVRVVFHRFPSPLTLLLVSDLLVAINFVASFANLLR